MNRGINVDEIFWFKEPQTGNIFIGLNQMETSSAKEQLVRASLAE